MAPCSQACPVPFRSAPIPFPFIDGAPSFPPLALCCRILPIRVWSRSDRGRGGKGFSKWSSCLFLVHRFLSVRGAYGRRWQSLGSKSEVGTRLDWIQTGEMLTNVDFWSRIRLGCWEVVGLTKELPFAYFYLLIHGLLQIILFLWTQKSWNPF